MRGSVVIIFIFMNKSERQSVLLILYVRPSYTHHCIRLLQYLNILKLLYDTINIGLTIIIIIISTRNFGFNKIASFNELHSIKDLYKFEIF